MRRSAVPLFLTTAVAASLALAVGAESSAPFDLHLDVIRRGYDGATCMVQARTGILPRDGQAPILVTTMSPLVVAGSDVYLGVHDMRSDDGGKTWVDARRMILTPFLNLGSMVRTQPLVLQDGSIGLPAYHEFVQKWGQWIRMTPSSPGAIRRVARIGWSTAVSSAW